MVKVPGYPKGQARGEISQGDYHGVGKKQPIGQKGNALKKELDKSVSKKAPKALA